MGGTPWLLAPWVKVKGRGLLAGILLESMKVCVHWAGMKISLLLGKPFWWPVGLPVWVERLACWGIVQPVEDGLLTPWLDALILAATPGRKIWSSVWVAASGKMTSLLDSLKCTDII